MQALIDVGLGAKHKDGGVAVSTLDIPEKKPEDQSAVDNLVDKVEDLNLWDRFVKWLREVMGV